MESHTFKPATKYYEMEMGVSNGDKCLDLYLRTKQGQYIKNNIKEPDVEFEMAREECNFRPQINPYGSHLSKPHQTLDQIKGVKEKVNMLAKGRDI